jgi:hypothetical protein
MVLFYLSTGNIEKEILEIKEKWQQDINNRIER